MVYKGKSHWIGWLGGTPILGNLHIHQWNETKVAYEETRVYIVVGGAELFTTAKSIEKSCATCSSGETALDCFAKQAKLRDPQLRLTAKLQDGTAAGLPSVGVLFWCVFALTVDPSQDLAALDLLLLIRLAKGVYNRLLR